mmetsp:Transcript_37582/g.94897  ORF Transcript_37582/g.94897 Transcript_37582/m.94897 type:complete len:350 (+) Transcript_37582:1628-2677(+)
MTQLGHQGRSKLAGTSTAGRQPNQAHTQNTHRCTVQCIQATQRLCTGRQSAQQAANSNNSKDVHQPKVLKQIHLPKREDQPPCVDPSTTTFLPTDAHQHWRGLFPHGMNAERRPAKGAGEQRNGQMLDDETETNQQPTRACLCVSRMCAAAERPLQPGLHPCQTIQTQKPTRNRCQQECALLVGCALLASNPHTKPERNTHRVGSCKRFAWHVRIIKPPTCCPVVSTAKPAKPRTIPESPGSMQTTDLHQTLPIFLFFAPDPANMSSQGASRDAHHEPAEEQAGHPQPIPALSTTDAESCDAQLFTDAEATARKSCSQLCTAMHTPPSSRVPMPTNCCCKACMHVRHHA